MDDEALLAMWGCHTDADAAAAAINEEWDLDLTGESLADAVRQLGCYEPPGWEIDLGPDEVADLSEWVHWPQWARN